MKTVIAFLALCITTVLSKQCYSCSYNFPAIEGMNIPKATSECKDTFDKENKNSNIPMVECDMDCYKLKAEGNGVAIVIRGCGNIAKGIPCVEQGYDQGGMSGGYYCCDGDKCNSASGLKITSGLALVMLIAYFLYL